MSDQLTITFECLDCGGTVLELPDDHTDESIAICKSCRRPFGPYGEIKAKAIDTAASDLRKQAEKTFADIQRTWNRRR